MKNKLDDVGMKEYFAGKKLYGNDFTQEQINSWFNDEANGYFELTKAGDGEYSYGYHALNERHGFSGLPERRFEQVLGVGSAYGEELDPIISCCDGISILEPSDGFRNTTLRGVPVSYVKPLATGDVPFESESIDLITCLGVLHHIPNVEKVISEFHRVLKPNGFALVREPVISMGDWRYARPGLTKHERGIPAPIFRQLIVNAGFEIVHERKCVFSLTSRLKHLLSGSPFNNKAVVALDAWISALPIWSRKYHAQNVWQKLRPTAVYYVLKKNPIC